MDGELNEIIPLNTARPWPFNGCKRYFNAKTKHDWHGVACALRLKSGKVVTSFVLEAENPALTICAEPIAIGKALEQLVDDPIITIVAVREREDTDHKVSPNQKKNMQIFNERLSDPEKYSSVILPTAEGMTVGLKLF